MTMAGQANTMQYGNKSGMFGNMNNTQNLMEGLQNTAANLGAPEVDINDPASLREKAARQAKSGDMAGSQQSLSMAQSVERSTQNKTEYGQRQASIVQGEIDKTFADGGRDALAANLEVLGYELQAKSLIAGIMSPESAMALYTGHDQKERDEAKAVVAKATAAAREKRAGERHDIATDSAKAAKNAVTAAGEDTVALTKIREEFAQQAIDGEWGDQTFVAMMRNGLPMNPEEVYAARAKAYNASAEGMRDVNATRDADDKVEAYVLSMKPWPQTPQGQADMKAELASVREKLSTMSSGGRVAWVGHQRVNAQQELTGHKKLWVDDTATSRAFAKNQQELLGDWGELDANKTSLLKPSTWGGDGPRPSKQWNRDMQLSLAQTAESLSFNNPSFSAGLAQDIVLRKFKEVLEADAKDGVRTSLQNMNYKMSVFLLDQRANAAGDMAAIMKTGGKGGMSESDYLTAANAANASEGNN
jgi:hypothetical protein